MSVDTLFKAISDGNLKKVMSLCQKDDIQDMIHYAVEFGHFNIMFFLYKAGANLNNRSRFTKKHLLYTAVKYKHMNIIKWLIHKKPRHSKNLLHIILRQGQSYYFTARTITLFTYDEIFNTEIYE